MYTVFIAFQSKYECKNRASTITLEVQFKTNPHDINALADIAQYV